MSHGKHFTLYSHIGGPNGWKVAFTLNLLGLSYETHFLTYEGVKKPEYTKYNPNGRAPTLIDHKNNDYVIWESDAILIYLTEKYDTERKISVEGFEEKLHLYQWLFFQASGQGPYYGQAWVFQALIQPRVDTAVERYQNEIKRVLSVLESVLSKQEWLVGGKFTVADLSFVTWNNNVPHLLGESFDFAKEYPSVAAWHAKLNAIPEIKVGVDERLRLLAEGKN